MIKLSQTAKDLIRLMKKREVDEDSAIGVMLLLKSKGNAEENYAAMLKWIQENPAADQSDIYDKMEEERFY